MTTTFTNKFLIIVGLLLMVACSNKSTIIVNDEEYTANIPPGTIQINDNLFADVTEISNLDYRTFYNWMKQVYSAEADTMEQDNPDLCWIEPFYVIESEEILSITPKQECVESWYQCFTTDHFRHPAFNNHPIVGITLEQAKKYSKWRTDRVLERLLVERRWIEYKAVQNKDNHFTLERYQSGEYESIIVHQSLLIPVYSIPTEEEWIYLATGNSSYEFGIDVDILPKSEKEYFDSGEQLFNSKEYWNKRVAKTIMLIKPSKCFPQNLFGIYDVFGNVSEMIDKEGYSKGGSWQHTKEDSKSDVLTPFTSPNAWTGFRNICRWEKIEIIK